MPERKMSWKIKMMAVFMMIMGLGMAFIWANDIAGNMFSNQGHFFQWRNEGGDLLWLHILAECLTASGLIIAALGLFSRKSWALKVSYLALGALIYTSINSFAWAFADPERYAYAVPMLFGLVGSLLCLFVLGKQG